MTVFPSHERPRSRSLSTLNIKPASTLLETQQLRLPSRPILCSGRIDSREGGPSSWRIDKLTQPWPSGTALDSDSASVRIEQYRHAFERLRRSQIRAIGQQNAIAWIRANYAKPLRVEHLAEIADIGVSMLHHHFRVLTAMSSLQYRKRLRLRALRSDTKAPANSIEYSRCFGHARSMGVRSAVTSGFPQRRPTNPAPVSDDLLLLL